MGRELPQFLARQEVSPGPLVNSAPIWTAFARLTNNIQKQTTAAAQESANERAARLGAQAGDNIAFESVKGGGEATRVFNKAAVEANKYTLGADIGKQVDRQFQDSIKTLSDDSLPFFQKSINGYAQGLLSSVPLENRAYAKNLITYHATIAASKISKLVADRNNALLQGQFDHTFNGYLNEASNAARQGDMNAALSFYTQAQSGAQNALNNGIISGKKYNQYLINGQKLINEQDALGKFEDAFQRGKGQQFIDKFPTDPAWNKQFSPVEKAALVKQMQGIIKSRAQEEGLNTQRINELKKTLILQAQNGMNPDPKLLSTVAEVDPKGIPDLNARIDVAKNQHAIVSNTDFDTLGEMKQKQQQLLEPITGKELADPNASLISSMHLAAAKDIQQKIKTLSTDPMVSVSNNPLYTQTTNKLLDNIPNPINQTEVKTFVQTGQLPVSIDGISSVKSFLNSSSNEALNIQRQRGLPESEWRLLPNSISSRIVGNINKQGLEGGLQTLQRLGNLYGDNFRYVMRGLVKNGLPESYQMMAGLQDNPQSEPFLGDVQGAFELKSTDIDKSLESKVRTNINDEVGTEMGNFISSLNNYASQNVSQQAAMRGNVEKLAYWFKIKDPGMSNQAVAQKAFQILIGNRYSEITPNYRVPLNVNPSAVRFMMNQMKSKLADFNFKLLGTSNAALSKQFQRASDFKDAILKGHWVSNPDDSGWTYVDVMGRPVRDLQGNTYSFTAADLDNPAFRLNFIDAQRQAKNISRQEIATTVAGAIPGGFAIPEVDKILKSVARGI